MAIVTLGIDLAKNVFALHGVDATGKAVLVRPSVPRGKLLELVASLPPCLIGMEARSGPITGLACSTRTATPCG
jgi:transposase